MHPELLNPVDNNGIGSANDDVGLPPRTGNQTPPRGGTRTRSHTNGSGTTVSGTAISIQGGITGNDNADGQHTQPTEGNSRDDDGSGRTDEGGVSGQDILQLPDRTDGLGGVRVDVH